MKWATTTYPDPMSQQEALKYASRNNGRLPTEDELKSVSLDEFTDVEGKEWTWSSTPDVYVGIGKPERPSFKTSDYAYVRLVFP